MSCNFHIIWSTNGKVPPFKRLKICATIFPKKLVLSSPHLGVGRGLGWVDFLRNQNSTQYDWFKDQTNPTQLNFDWVRLVDLDIKNNKNMLDNKNLSTMPFRPLNF